MSMAVIWSSDMLPAPDGRLFVDPIPDDGEKADRRVDSLLSVVVSAAEEKDEESESTEDSKEAEKIAVMTTSDDTCIQSDYESTEKNRLSTQRRILSHAVRKQTHLQMIPAVVIEWTSGLDSVRGQSE